VKNIFIIISLVSSLSHAQEKSMLREVAAPIIERTCANGSYSSMCLTKYPEFYLQTAFNEKASRTMEARREMKVGVESTANLLGNKIFVTDGEKIQSRYEYARAKDGSEYILRYVAANTDASGVVHGGCNTLAKIQKGQDKDECVPVAMNDNIKTLFASDVVCQDMAKKEIKITNCSMLATALKNCLEIDCNNGLQRIYAKGEADALPKADANARPQGEKDSPIDR
jgi:hypothetical protein